MRENCITRSDYVKKITMILVLLIIIANILNAKDISGRIYLRNGTIVKFSKFESINRKGNSYSKYLPCYYEGTLQNLSVDKLKYIKFLDINYGNSMGNYYFYNMEMEIATTSGVIFNDVSKPNTIIKGFYVKIWNNLTEEYNKQYYSVGNYNTLKLNIKKIEFDN